MSDVRLRLMEKRDWREVAELICVSTNQWYQQHGRSPVFPRGPESTMVFCEVYESLDPGCCLLVEDSATGQIMGSCFFHPRPTHMSLGILNVHPAHFGRGVAKRMLRWVIDAAQKENKPVRLVSSAMNLDSFSLYTRAGFVPQATFQDMLLAVPEQGLSQQAPGMDRVRPARREDVPAMAALEKRLAGLDREKDLYFFLENALGIWHTSVYENARGEIDGFLVSVCHPGMHMLGPGLMRTEEQAAALMLTELNGRKGETMVFLVSVSQGSLVQQAYSWGATNCEMHLWQVLGPAQPVEGIAMPSFLPESA